LKGTLNQYHCQIMPIFNKGVMRFTHAVSGLEFFGDKRNGLVVDVASSRERRTAIYWLFISSSRPHATVNPRLLFDNYN
jgi:hypothetical protein